MEETPKTDQPGHWYKCQNKSCDLKIPLPDKLFINLDVDMAWPTECKCGYMNYFKYSDAEDETKKWEVDHYFNIRDPRNKAYFTP